MADPNPPTPPPAASAPPSAAATNSQTSSQSKLGAYDMFKELILIPIDKSIFATLPEIGHLAPIILTMGSLFFAAITMNYPFFMLAFSSLEASLIFKGIQGFASYIETPTTSRNENLAAACKSYFQTISASRFRSLLEGSANGSIPNFPLYFISYAAAYCIGALQYFNKECSALGPQYSNRIYLAIASAAMFILLYTLYLLVYHCDGFLKLGISCVIGLFVGYLICMQNASVFGKESVDLLFIPSIVPRTGMDYVCVSSAPSVLSSPSSTASVTSSVSSNSHSHYPGVYGSFPKFVTESGKPYSPDFKKFGYTIKDGNSFTVDMDLPFEERQKQEQTLTGYFYKNMRSKNGWGPGTDVVSLTLQTRNVIPGEKMKVLLIGRKKGSDDNIIKEEDLVPKYTSDFIDVDGKEHIITKFSPM